MKLPQAKVWHAFQCVGIMPRPEWFQGVFASGVIMARGLVVIVVLVGLAIAGATGTRWIDTESDSGEPTTVCTPMAEDCRWSVPGGEASVTMASVDGYELSLNVTLPGYAGPVMVVLTGDSMYMGEYPLRMEPAETSGRFRVQFVPPFCSTGDNMVWQVNLRAGTDPIDLPFRLLFSPEAH